MKKTLLACLSAALLISSCDTENKKAMPVADGVTASIAPASDSVVYSFVFTGCNRLDRGDIYNPTITDASTANKPVLKVIWNDITALQRKPDLFFFLGDLVLGESDTRKLDEQLKGWLQLYYDTAFSNIAASGIELVAIPGNHEMLYSKNVSEPGQPKDYKEFPLAGATDVWLKHMSAFMPKDRTVVGGADSLNDRMSFSFRRNGIGFVVMNTDTYNAPTPQNKYGLEGQTPSKWVMERLDTFKTDTAISHIFAVGHRPYYVDGGPNTGHGGLPGGPVLWPAFNAAGVVALLSAHKHDHQLWHLPADTGTYQVIAGNAGSSGTFNMGYSIINMLQSGKVQLIFRYFPVGPYYYNVITPVSWTNDTIMLKWK